MENSTAERTTSGMKQKISAQKQNPPASENTDATAQVLGAHGIID
jgi:hypothetical protein